MLALLRTAPTWRTRLMISPASFLLMLALCPLCTTRCRVSVQRSSSEKVRGNSSELKSLDPTPRSHQSDTRITALEPCIESPENSASSAAPNSTSLWSAPRKANLRASPGRALSRRPNTSRSPDSASDGNASTTRSDRNASRAPIVKTKTDLSSSNSCLLGRPCFRGLPPGLSKNSFRRVSPRLRLCSRRLKASVLRRAKSTPFYDPPSAAKAIRIDRPIDRHFLLGVHDLDSLLTGFSRVDLKLAGDSSGDERLPILGE